MDSNQDFSRDTYQTGSTCPPKNRRGLIAFLMVLVIFLCGVSTALGLMNVHLFRQLSNKDETVPMDFSGVRTAQYTEDFLFPGFAGQEIPEVYSLYQEIPQGIYITQIIGAEGIQVGDILLQVEGQTVTSADQLQKLLSGKNSVNVVLYRNEETVETTLKIPNL